MNPRSQNTEPNTPKSPDPAPQQDSTPDGSLAGQSPGPGTPGRHESIANASYGPGTHPANEASLNGMLSLTSGSLPVGGGQPSQHQATDSAASSPFTTSPFHQQTIQRTHAAMMLTGTIPQYPPAGAPNAARPGFGHPFGGMHQLIHGWSPGMMPPAAPLSSPQTPRIKRVKLDVVPTSQGPSAILPTSSPRDTTPRGLQAGEVLPEKTPSPIAKQSQPPPHAPPFLYWRGGYPPAPYGKSPGDASNSASNIQHAPYYVSQPVYTSSPKRQSSPSFQHASPLETLSATTPSTDSSPLSRSARAVGAASIPSRPSHAKKGLSRLPPIQPNSWRRLGGATMDNYSRAFLLYNAPYESQTSMPITEAHIRKAIPDDASCIFHVLDRRINMDSHPVDTSFYALLRSWIQDDPYRQVPPSGSNLLDFITLPPVRRRRDAESSPAVKTTLEPVDSLALLLDRDRKEADPLSSLHDDLVARGKSAKRKRRMKQSRQRRAAEERLVQRGIHLQAGKTMGPGTQTSVGTTANTIAASTAK